VNRLIGDQQQVGNSIFQNCYQSYDKLDSYHIKKLHALMLHNSNNNAIKQKLSSLLTDAW